MHNDRPDPHNQLTSHVLAARNTRVVDPASVPRIGDVIDCRFSLISRQRPDATPMTKIRRVGQRWVQVDPSEAGMMVFFAQDEPVETHVKMTILSIVPRGTACYASLS